MKATDVRERSAAIIADLIAAHGNNALPPDFSAVIQ